MAFIGSILTTGSFTGAHKQVATLKSSGGGGGTDSESADSTSFATSGSFDLVIQTGDYSNGTSFRGTSGSLRIDVKSGGSYLRALRIGASQYGSFLQTGNPSLTDHKFSIVTPTQVEYMRVDPVSTSTVFNEGSADLDFRVESNSNTHMLFVNGGTNRVGINNSSPSTTLDVSGDITGQTLLATGDTSAGDDLSLIHI